MILPIFLLVSVGFVAQKILKMDSRTFSKLNIYIFAPVVLFTKIYKTDISLKFFGILLVFILIMEMMMLIIGELVAIVFKYPRSVKKAFCNSLLFFNSGNFGLPFVDLAFKSNPVAVTSQIFIMLIQNTTCNTLGVFQASSGKSSRKEALKSMLLMPTLYVLILVFIVKVVKIQLTARILVPLQYISEGFIGLALITLGVQLAEINFKFKFKDVFAASFIRLIISPILGFLLVMCLGVKGIPAQSMILGVAMPSAVNTAIIAKEFNNEPEYASQIVMVSTILSSITISAVFYLIRDI